ncbi:ABC transporter ATP-binding protein, partial [Bordetella pseudohinzii]
ALPLRELRTLPEDLIQDVVMCRLDMVGLNAKDALKSPSDLSGGMIKRVGLARALALDPELLFLDEPTAGLDPVRSDEFVDLVRSLHRQLGFTVVMVTHDLDTLLELATRVAVLADKRVIACDKVSEILKIHHPFIQSFFLGERGRRALGDLAPKDAGNGKP